MPVRSLHSSVLRWPDGHAVENALRAWVARVTAERAEVRRVGYFGSYARGDWGVGSDVDLIVIVAGSEDSFERRAAGWNTASLPVPADLLVYTADEWQAMQRAGRLSERMTREIIWLYDRAEIET
jgi:nucleotidyltransferase-like protein